VPSIKGKKHTGGSQKRIAGSERKISGSEQSSDPDPLTRNNHKLRHFLVDNEENIAETVDDDRFRSDIIPTKVR